MALSVFNSRALQDEAAAYRWVEAQIWPDGPVCPHCGGVDRLSPMKRTSTPIGTAPGHPCRKPLTGQRGTLFPSSHIPIRMWRQGMVLIAAHKDGGARHERRPRPEESPKTA